MLNICILVSGGGTNLQAIIDAISSGKLTGVRISAVISNNEGAHALERARSHGLAAVTVAPKSFESRALYDVALIKCLAGYHPDLIVLAGFLVTVSKEMIDQYPNRIINVHPSLIPAFCGVGCYGIKVHQKALERGVKITGATVHYVDEGVDSGPIILQKAVAVEPSDTPKMLQQRVMEQAEWIILPEAIQMIADRKEAMEK